MKCVVKYNDGKNDWYFSRFGMWGLPVWVGKSKMIDARIFETKQEARQWIREFLSGAHNYRGYTVERI